MANEDKTAQDPYSDLVFEDLEPKFVDVWLTSKKPDKPSHRLREATEDVACKFRNAAMRAARMTDGKVVGVDGMADCEPILVAGCLFKLVPDPKSPGGVRELACTVGEVRSWSARVVGPLFDRAKLISGMTDAAAEGGDGPKAPPAPTPTTSGTPGTPGDSPPCSGGVAVTGGATA